MTLRKAAALALVGWYLMMPPWGKLNAPLSEWVVYQSFDSAENCAAARKVLVDYLANYKAPDRFWYAALDQSRPTRCGHYCCTRDGNRSLVSQSLT
jgi:hypothetical protein